VLTLY